MARRAEDQKVESKHLEEDGSPGEIYDFELVPSSKRGPEIVTVGSDEEMAIL